jgi:hypothetical protein
MAKISSYTNASPVTLSDKLIGTDTSSNDATKNFTVGDILSLFNNPTSLTGFVPYTGATANVDLGAYDLNADYIEGTNEIYSPLLEGDVVEVYNRLFIDNGADISLDGDEGNPGDILLSQGGGVTPIWETQATLFSGLVPYTGATGNIDLGLYDLDANNVSAGDGSFTEIYEGGNKLTSYLQAFSLINQTQATVGTAKIIEFETASFSDTVTIVSNLITFNAIGKYMIEVTARVEHLSGGGDAVLNIWLQSATGLLANTRQTFTIPNNHIQEIKYSFMLSAASPTDAIRAYWSTSNLNARYSSVFAGGIYPAAPSTILNVYKIG